MLPQWRWQKLRCKRHSGRGGSSSSGDKRFTESRKQKGKKEIRSRGDRGSGGDGSRGERGQGAEPEERQETSVKVRDEKQSCCALSSRGMLSFKDQRPIRYGSDIRNTVVTKDGHGTGDVTLDAAGVEGPNTQGLFECCDTTGTCHCFWEAKDLQWLPMLKMLVIRAQSCNPPI